MPEQGFKTLKQWLQWQETLHPSEIDLGLERVNQVLNSLLPQCFEHGDSTFPFKVITVAGTNGKGSTVAMLESIYTEAGYKVGCYTSPHIQQYNERIKINRVPVSDEIICDSFSRIDHARGLVSLTYFEFGTLAAVDIFTAAQCEIVILEVGLGGRLDAVNVIDPDVALITTIDIDHQDWLGTDRNTIGFEKAGIYRRDKPAIFGDIDLPDSIRDKVNKEKLNFYQYSIHYQTEQRQGQWDWFLCQDNERIKCRYNLPEPQLKGMIQLKNAANVLMVAELLNDSFPVTQAEIKRGLNHCDIQGRFQIISSDPLVVLDVAHNVQAAEVLCDTISKLSVPGNFHVIIGMLKDKDVDEVLSKFLPMVDHWRFIELDSNRAMSANELNQRLQFLLKNNDITNKSKSVTADTFANFDEAYHDFCQYNKTSTGFNKLLVFGSFFTVADALKSLQNT